MQVLRAHFGNHDFLAISQIISHGYFLELRIEILNCKYIVAWASPDFDLLDNLRSYLHGPTSPDETVSGNSIVYDLCMQKSGRRSSISFVSQP